MCNLLGAWRLSSLSLAHRMGATNPSPFRWRTTVRQSKDCSMVAGTILFERASPLHRQMATWVFQLHCSWSVFYFFLILNIFTKSPLFFSIGQRNKEKCRNLYYYFFAPYESVDDNAWSNFAADGHVAAATPCQTDL